MNKNKNSKIMLILSILLLLFIVIGTATAADDTISNETVSTTTNNDGVDTQKSVDEGVSTAEDEIIGSSDTESNLKANDTTGTFTELYSIIRESENEYQLTKNFTFDINKDNSFTKGIVINKPFTIDGNGFFINGNNLARAFTINSNNVTLKNINIINTYEETAGSILWNGNNGKLINASFYNSTAYHTGSEDYAYAGFILWYGDNGQIKNSSFIKGTAKHNNFDAAGAISSNAINLTIDNSTFINNTGYHAAFTCTQSAANNYVTNCLFESNYPSVNGGVVSNRRSSVIFENCTFTKHTQYSVFSIRGSYTILNCTISDATSQIFCPNYSGWNVINCTFKNIDSQLSSTATVTSAFTIKGSTFINVSKGSTAGIMRPYNSKQVIILEDCIFDDCTRVIVANDGTYIINNCTFKNFNYEKLFGFYKENNRDLNVIFTNNTIIDCNFTKNNYGYLYYTNSVGMLNYEGTNISNTFYTTDSSPVNPDEYTSNYVPQFDVYVSENGNGTGTKGDMASLSDAFNIVAYGGTIHITPGTYTFEDRKDVSYSIVGEGEGVIINKGTFSFSDTNGYVLKNIIFNDTNKKSNLINNNMEVTNCNFTNCTNNIFTTNNGARNTIVKNIHVTNSNFKHFVEIPNLEEITFEDIVIDGCTFDTFISSGTHILTSYNDITIKNSNFTALVNHMALGMGQVFKNEVLYNVTLFNDTINGYIFNSRDSELVREDSVNVLNITNCIFNSTNPMFNITYNQKLSKIYIINLTNNYNASIFNLIYSGNSISSSVFNKFDTINLISGNNSYSLDTISVSNVKGDYGIITSEDCILNNVNFNNTAFKYGHMVLLDNCIYKNSMVKNYQGPVLINGSNVHIEGCSFINGRNNTVYSNGTSICLLNGDYFYIINCEFNNNTGYCGGAVYISNVTDSSNIINSKFTNNTALVLGGGIYYQDTGIHYYVDKLSSFSNNKAMNPKGIPLEGTNPLTKRSFNYNNIYDGTALASLEDIYVVLDPSHYVNSTGGNGTGSGEDADNPCSIAIGFYFIGEGSVIHFVNSSEVFVYDQTAPLIISKSNVKFLGNNTTLSNIRFNVMPIAGNLYMKDFIFTNNTDTVITAYSDNCTIENVVFENNGGDECGKGACIQLYGNNFTAIKSTFRNNNATSSDSFGAALYVNANLTTISNCTFENNCVSGYGSHIYISENSTNIKIINNTSFIKGSYLGSGGSAIVIDGSDVIINQTTFKNNTAKNNGGALFLRGKDIVIDNSIFDSNSASNGGAIYSTYSLNVNQCSFINNTATNNGGAVYLASSDNVISNALFTGNTAEHGSAIYLEDSKSLVINNVTLSDNKDKYSEGDCSIHVGEYASLSIPNNDLILGTDQGIHLTNYKTDVLYVSSSGSGYGLTMNDAAKLTSALLNYLNDGGKVIFINGVYDLSDVVEIYNKNIQFIGNASTITNKNDKSLFNNHLTHIK